MKLSLQQSDAERDGWLLVSPLLIAVVLAKVSFPPFADKGLGIGMPLILGVALCGLARGAFMLHAGSLMLYFLMCLWIGFLQLRGQPFSLASLFYLAAIYAPYLLRLKPTASQQSFQQRAVRYFSNTSTLFAALGIMQFIAQFAVGPELPYPLEHFLPAGYLIKNYNYLNVLYYGSTTYKANGVFFLEPSFYSQFLAIGILLELCLLNRPLRLLLHAVALVFTFSGTGLVVLAVGVLALIVHQRRFTLLMGLAIITICAITILTITENDFMLERATEFSRTNTSGFERFVAWTYMFDDYFWPDPARVLFGAGTGTFDAQMAVSRYMVAQMSFSKAIFEFGLPGATLYFGFVFYVIGTSTAPLPVRFGMATAILMNGAYSETITGILLTLLLWPSPARLELMSARAQAYSPGTRPFPPPPPESNVR